MKVRVRIDGYINVDDDNVTEKQVEEAEKAASAAAKDEGPSSADKVRHAVRKTVVTKRVVDLFFRNMSENDNNESENEK